ncbi:MAG TPA: serine hydrolase domain-containing protein [Sphingomicrobium sp.]|nr:serine hydrolase domain-containing protein [Sphingomicrobium sp.]
MYHVTRRQLVGGLASAPFLLRAGRAVAATAPIPARLAPAVAAIRDYAEQHRRFVGVPGLTLGLTAPDLPAAVVSVGTADREGHPIGEDTLFQIGSISKLVTAALIHQLASERRLSLAADARSLLPGAPWPAGPPITVQQLLDHRSGLPGNAPIFPLDGPLWLGSTPGSHWTYSNTGYGLLGGIIERVEGQPLARILDRRIFRPLGMGHSIGAILNANRAAYAQGFEPLERERIFVPGDPLTPAPWVEVTFAAGSIASTAADMVVLMRSLADAAAGRGGLGLGPAAGKAFAAHMVAAEEDMRYGNGLMHVSDGQQPVLHHTGGMPSFSSSFHLDPATRTGAFASVPLGYPAGYRPRLLTMFAVQALRAAAAGRPLPAPAPLKSPYPKVDGLAGAYVADGDQIAIMQSADGLAFRSGSSVGALIPAGKDMFATQTPGWTRWVFRFVRQSGQPVALEFGSKTFVRSGATFHPAASNPALTPLAGRFVFDSPWGGIINICERGGKLWIDGAQPLTPIGDKLYRLGEEEWSPERVRFGEMVGGRPMAIFLSGERYERRDV